ncbi:hypothetical protein O1611_g3088 [Lasiodiplodia mahajangana]|uniref:Uncharacterized protein n=1 Tax=Lasiodiplodia mahajangana TaxID=1108764 RepID=A0ACC2JT72_9PEZI|nr:hypothetical protein O1611_g3088 [Lasiodiplodia mahajangana]
MRSLEATILLIGTNLLYTVRDGASAPNLYKGIASSAELRSHDVVPLELTDLENVREVALIKLLMLNAGYQGFREQVSTNDFDTTFTANYLGRWLLTQLLLNSLDISSARYRRNWEPSA